MTSRLDQTKGVKLRFLSVMPSATGQNWEKYQKKFADDDEPEKKITPLSDEYVLSGLTV